MTVFIGREENVRWRALTEEHARDSFENLLFSVCRFRELTGTYPYNITVSPFYWKLYYYYFYLFSFLVFSFGAKYAYVHEKKTKKIGRAHV